MPPINPVKWPHVPRMMKVETGRELTGACLVERWPILAYEKVPFSLTADSRGTRTGDLLPYQTIHKGQKYLVPRGFGKPIQEALGIIIDEHGLDMEHIAIRGESYVSGPELLFSFGIYSFLKQPIVVIISLYEKSNAAAESFAAGFEYLMGDKAKEFLHVLIAPPAALIESIAAGIFMENSRARQIAK